MKKEMLENFKKNKKLVSLYSNVESKDAFNVEFIVDYDSKFLLLNSISEYGKYDGILLIYIDDIFRIDIDSNYENKLLRLLNNKEITNYKFKKIGSCIEKLFNYAKENNSIISISFFDSDYKSDVIGKVKSYNTNLVEICCYDEYGKVDGISYINISEINYASLDSLDEKMITNLIK